MLSTSAALAPASGFLSPALIDADTVIEATDKAKIWRSGDTVIHGITLRSPGRSQQWLVRIRVHSYPAEVDVADKPAVSMPWPSRGGWDSEQESTPVLVQVETFDASGQLQHAAHRLVPADEFEHGFHPGCLVGVTAGIKEEVEGDRVILSFSLTSEETEPVRSFPGVSDPVYSFPFEVRIYESPALRGRLFVTDSHPPFLPTGGIVAIEAAHPDDPVSTVSVRLLSATRRPPDATVEDRNGKRETR